MYYEVHGEGEPLVLLHGAYMSVDSNWAGPIPTLAKDHKVIAVELQSHGHTSDRDTPITYEGMSDDVAALLDELKIDKAALFGFSMGGGVAIRFAIDHPEKVTRIVAASAGYKYDEETMGPDFMKMIEGITPEMFANTLFEGRIQRLNPPGEFSGAGRKLNSSTSPPSTGRPISTRSACSSLYIYGDADIVGLDYIAKAPPGCRRPRQRRHARPAQDPAAGPPRHQPHQRVLQPRQCRDHEGSGPGLPEAGTPGQGRASRADRRES